MTAALLPRASLTGLLLLLAGAEADAASCPVTHDRLAQALKQSVAASGGPSNGGLDTHQWAAVVDRDGLVCAVAFSGANPDDQWPGSRAIAAEKANTANALSLKQLAFSTANLYAGGQPGGPLYGLAATNPPATDLIYAGEAQSFGGASDPMLGKRVGGVVAFGGGLALYDGNGIVGGMGVSGDTSCADHNVAWRLRQTLGLDKVPAGMAPQKNDAIIYDIGPDGKSASGFGHAKCNGRELEVAQQIGAGVAPP